MVKFDDTSGLYQHDILHGKAENTPVLNLFCTHVRVRTCETLDILVWHSELPSTSVKMGQVSFLAVADGSSLYYTKTSRVSRMQTITDADTET